MPAYIYRVSRREPGRAAAQPVPAPPSDVAEQEPTAPEDVPNQEDVQEPEVSYRELQQQAKAAGINARQSREELEAALSEGEG